MEQPIEPLLETLDKLCGFRPDFIAAYGRAEPTGDTVKF